MGTHSLCMLLLNCPPTPVKTHHFSLHSFYPTISSQHHNLAKNMRRFGCHSPAATAVCLSSEPLSIIVPRRPDTTLSDRARLINRKDYTRILDARRASSVPSLKVSNADLKNQVLQVVVMRVSLHCQGCAGKVKKHLSKMEGVTSFSIDLESKRVTVTGHVSPLVLVESISKVKRAELWPSATC